MGNVPRAATWSRFVRNTTHRFAFLAFIHCFERRVTLKWTESSGLFLKGFLPSQRRVTLNYNLAWARLNCRKVILEKRSDESDIPSESLAVAVAILSLSVFLMLKPDMNTELLSFSYLV